MVSVMNQAGRSFSRVALVLLVASAAAFACSAPATKAKPAPGDPDYEDPPTDKPLDPPLAAGVVEDDSGAFDLGGRESTGGQDAGGARDDAGAVVKDAGSVTKDASAPILCAGALANGDVKVVEVMIAAASGSGDKGKWLELQSTRQCTLNLKGLRVESPRGTGVDTAAITTDFMLPPNGIFVVADSALSADNHGVGVVAAAFGTADVLKNDGDTLSVYAGTSTLIDTLTYPKFTLFIGRSVSFPWDCSWSDRSSWARWSWSFNTWNTPFQGTPSGDNSDVACF
ncbi:hypothetical protein BH09MYX1_BH09MYX1_47010 [soil metagenome]